MLPPEVLRVNHIASIASNAGVDGQSNSLKQVLRVHGQSTNQLATQECECKQNSTILY